jgi:hypothetical protein
MLSFSCNRLGLSNKKNHFLKLCKSNCSMRNFLLLFAVVSLFAMTSCGGKGTTEAAQETAATEAVEPQSLSFPTLAASYLANTTINLTVGNGGDAYEYLWWVKEGQEDWVVATNWSSSNTLTFVPQRPGTYAFQVDYRSKSNPSEVMKKWLGQTAVNGN